MTTMEPVIAPTKPVVKPFNPSRPAKPLVDPGPKNNQPVITPTKPGVKPFNPSRPAKPRVDPGPKNKNYQEELKKSVDRYNKLIAEGMKPEVKTITGK